MNFPGKTTGNYQWRLKSGQASSELAMKVAEMAKTYGRT
jgi:4-alpha-glucanotransferase